jgi:hypothetical protein
VSLRLGGASWLSPLINSSPLQGKLTFRLGAAPESTDLAVQQIRLKRGELRRIDERPYRAFVASDGDMVMLSTGIYTHFSRKPAAFSRQIATRELRDRLGWFAGVSISDTLETVSARHFGGPAKGASPPRGPAPTCCCSRITMAPLVQGGR